MFNKNEFSALLVKAQGEHLSLNQFSAKCGISSAHLSRYIRELLPNPPKPNSIERIANCSEGRVSYEELMEAAGYIDPNETGESIRLFSADGKTVDISDLSKEDQDLILALAEKFRRTKDKKER